VGSHTPAFVSPPLEPRAGTWRPWNLASWTSVVATPPFPSYVSGHSSTSGAASTVLARFFPSQSRRLRALAAEAAISRLYGGIHFRSDNDAGLELGRRGGGAALQAYGLATD
jgi:membrane-associated phospholipid phosphatase